MSESHPTSAPGALLSALATLRSQMLEMERSFASELEAIPGGERGSARNLLHYLALRQENVQELQTALGELGLSSLGRSEAHVLATVDAVLTAVHRMAEQSFAPAEWEAPPVDFRGGYDRLAEHTDRLLGTRPPGRFTRIMVTLPSEAATDPSLTRRLVEAGMDLARVNCAHDDAERWQAMAANVRRASHELGRRVAILADLGGPKVRTGELEPGPRVLRWRPERDARGLLVAPARIEVVPAHFAEPTLDGRTRLPVEPVVLEKAQPGDELVVHDLRGRKRRVSVVELRGGTVVGECERGAWVEEGNRIDLRRGSKTLARGRVVGLHPIEDPIRLRGGDTLRLSRSSEAGHGARREGVDGIDLPARIACTLPSALDVVEPGHRVLFDDGKIAARVAERDDDGLTLVIERGGTLRADKGINFPDSQLQISGLTDKDRLDLDEAVQWADIVGLSFVQRSEDVLALEDALDERGAGHLGILLKIETRLAFEALPRLLLTGLQSPPVGVMVARGDLAVEVGYERLAEVQEEILWLCEAAHVPVVWATQVLETLAKKGQPSRAEVTDAAMSGRAEAVMLNKGPFVVQAVEFLDDVLRRMQSHQLKKTARLRRLSVSRLQPQAAGTQPPQRSRPD